MPVLMKVLVSNTVDDAIKHPENGIAPKRVQPRATGGAAGAASGTWKRGGAQLPGSRLRAAEGPGAGWAWPGEAA